jgi:tRNA1(Val) A37 N6-methylase TrmN6
MRMTGIIRRARRPPGWIPPGPKPAGARGRPELEPADDEDLAYLCGDFRIFQKLRGNRWSLDELVTGCVACDGPAPARALDLGCGIGSVLLMIAWRFPDARVIGVEAQEVSADLARRSIAYDGVEARCVVRLGDLRDEALVEPGAFDLVTGTPPYFRRGEGVESDKVQCAPARFEHRGGVEDYVRAASRALSAAGRFVVCTAAAQRPRVFEAARASSLAVTSALDVVPREGKPALVSVFTLARPEVGACVERTLTVRDRAGRWTNDFVRVREAMGLPGRAG